MAQDSAADALYNNSTQEHLLEKSSLADQHADFVLLFQKPSIFSKLPIMPVYTALLRAQSPKLRNPRVSELEILQVPA